MVWRVTVATWKQATVCVRVPCDDCASATYTKLGQGEPGPTHCLGVLKVVGSKVEFTHTSSLGIYTQALMQAQPMVAIV